MKTTAFSFAFTAGILGFTTALRRPELQVQGGGMSLPNPKTLAKAFAGFNALNGAIGMPAPESVKIVGISPAPQEGTSDYVIYENVGAVSLGYGLLIYLALTKGLARQKTKIIAYAGIPCFYTTYKNFLKGLTEKLSGNAMQGPVLTVFMGACLYCLISGKGDTDLIAKAFSLPVLALGAISELNPDLGMKLAGMGTTTSKNGRAFFMWWASLMVGWGSLALMLLGGCDALQSVGIIVVLETIFVADCVWFCKWNDGVVDRGSNYVFLAIPMITAAGILLQ
jgi:hypothetical protein